MKVAKNRKVPKDACCTGMHQSIGIFEYMWICGYETKNVILQGVGTQIPYIVE